MCSRGLPVAGTFYSLICLWDLIVMNLSVHIIQFSTSLRSSSYGIPRFSWWWYSQRSQNLWHFNTSLPDNHKHIYWAKVYLNSSECLSYSNSMKLTALLQIIGEKRVKSLNWFPEQKRGFYDKFSWLHSAGRNLKWGARIS
jgi:hypothetical protein